MCMTSVALNLEWNEKLQDFVGFGYRAGDDKLPVNQWLESGPDTLIHASLIYDSEKVISGPYKIGFGDNKYSAGFHIFLNKKDAESYGCGTPYKVCFTTVVAFGTNETEKRNDAPCVVARYMWVYPKC